MKEHPLISIIIPAYNRLKYLAKCLESVKAQEYKNYEIIVVDDGSSENLEKMREFCNKFIRNDINLGPAYSRNLGALNSKGEILLFLDSDTELLSDSLKKLPEIFKEDPSIAIVGGSGPPIGSERDVRYIIGRTYNWLGQSYTKHYYLSGAKHTPKLFDCHHVEAAFMAVRKDVFAQVGGFDPYWLYMGESRDLCLSVKAHGYRVVVSLDTRAIHLHETLNNPYADLKKTEIFSLSKFLQIAIKRNGILGGILWMIGNRKKSLKSTYFFDLIKQFKNFKQLIMRRNVNYLAPHQMERYYQIKLRD